MPTTHLKNHQKSTEISKLDFRDNTQLMLASYGLRLIGAVVFSIAFYLIVQQMYPYQAVSLESLIMIKLEDLPDIVSIVLIIIAVIGVLWLHEFIHASVFYIHTGASLRIGMRGPIIFASAIGYLNTRNVMIVNALAPYIVISLLGMLLMTVVPYELLAWIFIPMVANAAATGGDFMAVYWLLSIPTERLIEDHGDILVAHQSK